MYATDVRQKHRLMSPPYGGGDIITYVSYVRSHHDSCGIMDEPSVSVKAAAAYENVSRLATGGGGLLAVPSLRSLGRAAGYAVSWYTGAILAECPMYDKAAFLV